MRLNTKLLFGAAILLLILVIVIMETASTTTELGDCYDNNGNLMLGLQCEKEVYVNERIDGTTITMAVICALFTLGAIFNELFGEEE